MQAVLFFNQSFYFEAYIWAGIHTQEFWIIVTQMSLCLSVWTGDQKNMQHQSEPSRECNVQRKPWPTSHLFTSTPISSQFKTPIFQSEPDASSVINKQVQHEVIPVAPEHQINGVPDLNNSTDEPQLEQVFVIPTSTSKNTTSGMDHEDTEEDEQSIFYSPELFEGDEEEKEVVEKCPEVSHPLANSTASVLLEDLFGSVEGKRTLSEDLVSSAVPDNTLLQGSTEQTGLNCGTDIGSQNGGSSSRLRRLSRCRQKRLSTSAASGKLTDYFKHVPPTSQPCIITIDDWWCLASCMMRKDKKWMYASLLCLI